MNKIYKFICAVTVVFGLASCLDLEPQDQLGGDKMWVTENDFKNFANNFYNWLPNFATIYNDGSAHSDSRSDLMTYTSVNIYSKGTNSVPSTDGNYTGAYNHIRRCNLLLEAAEGFGNKDAIRQYVGEAYFYRAFSYFELVQLYGNVIIVKTPIDINSGELQAARNDRSEVIDFVIDDLRNAIGLLTPADQLTSENEGRVSMEAAQAFLSRVALYEGTWQKFHYNNTSRANSLLDQAAKAAKSVIDGGKFYLFGTQGESIVLGDSAQKYMFILENEQSNPANLGKSANHEYILTKRYDTTLARIGRNVTRETANNVQWITRNFANLYLCDDGLPIDKSPKFKGYATKKSEWQNRDTRMRYTLLMPGTHYWDNYAPRQNWNYGDMTGGYNYNGRNNDNSGYNNQKWASERDVADGYEGYDWPVIRYAEVLLNYAEAVFERDGKISDADLDLSLNKVRLRVNKTNNMPGLSNSLVSSNGLNMREEIRRERTVELYQEGFRIDDLKRWATAMGVMSRPLLGVKYTGTEWQTAGWNPSFSKDAEGCLIMDSNRPWTEKNYLLPLPTDQLQLNPQLKQNPGWE